MRNQKIHSLSKNGNTFTFSDAIDILGSDKNITKVILSRLESNGWIERIEKGKYIIIPLGSEKGKYAFHEFAIASMLVRPYCISYWSALHYYGMTEQIPNTVFIQTTARKKNQHLKIFGTSFQIIRLKQEKMFGIRNEWIEETKINIVNREKSIIDCLDRPDLSGGMHGVATAIKEHELNIVALSEYAIVIGNTAVIRRLGYLCDTFGIKINLPQPPTRNYLYLDPSLPHRGPKNSRWHLIINTEDKL